VVSSSVVPSRMSSRTTDQISLRLRGSSPVAGSSKNSTRGRVSKLDARSRRRRIPPEYVRAGRSAASAKSKRSSSSFARRRASPGDRSNRRPNVWRFSLPVSISSTAANWPVSPRSSRTLLDIQVDPGKRRGRPKTLDHTLDMDRRIRHHWSRMNSRRADARF
jgi:hypothetical protein